MRVKVLYSTVNRISLTENSGGWQGRLVSLAVGPTWHAGSWVKVSYTLHTNSPCLAHFPAADMMFCLYCIHRGATCFAHNNEDAAPYSFPFTHGWRDCSEHDPAGTRLRFNVDSTLRLRFNIGPQPCARWGGVTQLGIKGFAQALIRLV